MFDWLVVSSVFENQKNLYCGENLRVLYASHGQLLKHSNSYLSLIIFHVYQYIYISLYFNFSFLKFIRIYVYLIFILIRSGGHEKVA